MRRLIVLGFIGPLLLVTSGCGDSNKASVSGTLVRKDGSPLVGARIIARSKETGASATGITDGQGSFELGTSEMGDGIPPGNYYVVVIEDRGDPERPRPPSISRKYALSSSSGLNLSAEVGESKVFDATLDPP